MNRTRKMSSQNQRYFNFKKLKIYLVFSMYFVYGLLKRHSFWFLLANLECSSDDFHHFSQLPPVEISSLELPPKKHTDTHQANNTELRPGATDLQQQLNSSEEKSNGIHPLHGVNGMINSKPNGDKSIPPPAVLLSPTKEPPPVLAKPKLWVFLFVCFFSFL